MKAVILARVSTEEQREAGNSLPAQIERLKSYCQRNGFGIVGNFSFDESAYKTKRDEFDRILECLESYNETIAVCFDKVDRFSRNVFDKRVGLLYEMAMQDKIELHFSSDNLVITSKISAAEKFHFGINLGLAKYYSDAISDSTKRATEQKLRNGEWPGKAPLGYINTTQDNGKKLIIPDPERETFVKRIFEMYATGKYSMKMVAKELRKDGLSSKLEPEKRLSTSMIEHILKNPFYYGVMLYKGKLYPHKYDTLISRYLYNKCQEVAQNWNKKPTKYAAIPFALRGLIKCGTCGCILSPERKKGKYVYYGCTNYRGVHERKLYITEETLLEPIYEALKGLHIPEPDMTKLTKDLKKLHETESSYHSKAMAGLQQEYGQIEARVSRMYEDRLDGRITTDMHDKKLKEYKDKQGDILLQMEEHSKGDENFYLNAVRVLDVASRAVEILESSKPEEKRAFLSFLLQNPVLQDKKLVFELKTPFDQILECSKTQNWLPRRVQNHVLRGDSGPVSDRDGSVQLYFLNLKERQNLRRRNN